MSGARPRRRARANQPAEGGQPLQAGQPIATSRAMNMEAHHRTPRAAPCSGRAIGPVQQAEGGDLLVVIDEPR